MADIADMLATHPVASPTDPTRLADAIEALRACADACVQCADACMAEPDVGSLRRCIRLDLDCADICGATARVVSRRSETDPEVVRALLEACVVACRSCATECSGHADHMEHCRLCANRCRRCEEACAALTGALR